MQTLNIGGVPEHFNLPWRLTLESGEFDTSSLNTSWQDYPAGTGAMVAALNTGDLDIAILVTEGAVAAQQKPGCDFDILSFYTTSPLLWGMHVPAASKIKQEQDFRGLRYAISRYGSGSHLMAQVHAKKMGWPPDEIQFVLIEDLDGARLAFQEQRAEVFFWEHYTTKPYVDNGEFRWLGDFPPPWPGFVVCINRNTRKRHATLIEQLLAKVFDQAQQLKQSPKTSALIADRYQLNIEDVDEWLDTTQWSSHQQLDQQILTTVTDAINWGVTDKNA